MYMLSIMSARGLKTYLMPAAHGSARCDPVFGLSDLTAGPNVAWEESIWRRHPAHELYSLRLLISTGTSVAQSWVPVGSLERTAAPHGSAYRRLPDAPLRPRCICHSRYK